MKMIWPNYDVKLTHRWKQIFTSNMDNRFLHIFIFFLHEEVFFHQLRLDPSFWEFLNFQPVLISETEGESNIVSRALLSFHVFCVRRGVSTVALWHNTTVCMYSCLYSCSFLLICRYIFPCMYPYSYLCGQK